MLGSVAASAFIHPPLQNDAASTPQMGWNTYNHYSCSPNESIVYSNAKALVDLDHEAQDAQTFASWNIDSLKYDNCYSDAASNYPDVNYAPSTSPEPRYANMSDALLQQNRTILFQICEWGISFPAQWAPSIGNSRRIGNDIILDWRTIFRIIDQAAPQADFAGQGTHFSLWAILKSPLIIGAALKDELTSINDASLDIPKQTDVISFNQDSLGESASLRKRWTEEAYENKSRELTLDLPDIGLQCASSLNNIWDDSTGQDVRTSYTATVAGHGTGILELQNTTASGIYSTAIFGSPSGTTTTFEPIYAITTSDKYALTVYFAESVSSTTIITVESSASNTTTSPKVPFSATQASTTTPLTAGSNTITIDSSLSISSIQVTAPNGTYYPSTIGHISPSGSAKATISATSSGSKYLAIDYIKNDVAFESSWGWGSNSRNLTVTVNSEDPVRLEVPLSGRHM
ncbi:glycoside hydrolase [Aspergillus heteromorphus CBS 117.55]|uniref:alpha-galactosidase n=1 Tax=Aspergillus heteromorphus CBS 117.55 TaxID=1448321 RepID=A0A317VR29_9EURO|nr:glycoside hydrolase [Aspergillus heteromorphus CBS 117.55]PWY75477.1 glycoside hydrolase [Aspergillus heteromorphus CBS 117.55]